MCIPPWLSNEDARLRAVDELLILDTPPEPEFENVVAIVARECRAPIAIVTIVSEDRTWFKAVKGLALREVPRDLSFCSHVLPAEGVFSVEDTTRDSRFFDHPFVVGKLRALLGRV